MLLSSRGQLCIQLDRHHRACQFITALINDKFSNNVGLTVLVVGALKSQKHELVAEGLPGKRYPEQRNGLWIKM
jgi:hypothetical protein